MRGRRVSDNRIVKQGADIEHRTQNELVTDESRHGENLQAQLGLSNKKLASNLALLKQLRRKKFLRRISLLLTTISIALVMLAIPMARGYLWPDPSTWNATCRAVLFLAGFWALTEQALEAGLRFGSRALRWSWSEDESVV
jgi:hypothetical protein